METIIGIENLKDQFRLAKLKVGDLRGLKNKMELSERLGINPMQTLFYSFGGNAGERCEVYADVSEDGGEHSYWEYSMKDMIDSVMKSDSNEFEISLNNCKWNKHRTDADRNTIIETFIFKKQ